MYIHEIWPSQFFRTFTLRLDLNERIRLRRPPNRQRYSLSTGPLVPEIIHRTNQRQRIASGVVRCSVSLRSTRMSPRPFMSPNLPSPFLVNCSMRFCYMCRVGVADRNRCFGVRISCALDRSLRRLQVSWLFSDTRALISLLLTGLLIILIVI